MGENAGQCSMHHSSSFMIKLRLCPHVISAHAWLTQKILQASDSETFGETPSYDFHLQDKKTFQRYSRDSVYRQNLTCEMYKGSDDSFRSNFTVKALQTSVIPERHTV